MLSEERYAIILDYLNQHKTVTISELTKRINTSESTVRRDLTLLADLGKLRKIRGGAAALTTSVFTTSENDMDYKYTQHGKEKKMIAAYAATFIKPDDFVFIDAGTTTEALVDALIETKASFVTNGLLHAKKLAEKGFTVMVLPGRVRHETEAIVGTQTLDVLEHYHFTCGFFGTNGIDPDGGFTTPNPEEASVKRKAMLHCKKTYILADSSKFNRVTPVGFAALKDADIITDCVNDSRYQEKTTIKEVGNDLYGHF